MKIVKHYNLGKKRRLTLVGETEPFQGSMWLQIAYALKSPEDTFDKVRGEQIATNRLHHDTKDFIIAAYGFDFLVKDNKFLPRETVEQLLDFTAEYFKSNLHNFVKGIK